MKNGKGGKKVKDKELIPQHKRMAMGEKVNPVKKPSTDKC